MLTETVVNKENNVEVVTKKRKDGLRESKSIDLYKMKRRFESLANILNINEGPPPARVSQSERRKNNLYRSRSDTGIVTKGDYERSPERKIGNLMSDSLADKVEINMGKP